MYIHSFSQILSPMNRIQKFCFLLQWPHGIITHMKLKRPDKSGYTEFIVNHFSTTSPQQRGRIIARKELNQLV